MCLPPDQVVQILVLVGDIVLCSAWTRHFNHSPCVWVAVNLMVGVILQWTSIPSRGSRNTPSCFMLQKLARDKLYLGGPLGLYADLTIYMKTMVWMLYVVTY